jgi:hypothetical protein
LKDLRENLLNETPAPQIGRDLIHADPLKHGVDF